MTDTKTRKVELKGPKQDLGALIEQVSAGRQRIVLEKNGQTRAVILSPQEYERLLLLDRERERAFAVVDRIRGRLRVEVRHQERQQVDRAVQAAREETRKESKAARTA